MTDPEQTAPAPTRQPEVLPPEARGAGSWGAVAVGALAVGALAVGLKRRTLDQQEGDLPNCIVGRAGLRIFEQFGQGDCEEAPQRSGFIVGQRIHQIGHVQQRLSPGCGGGLLGQAG